MNRLFRLSNRNLSVYQSGSRKFSSKQGSPKSTNDINSKTAYYMAALAVTVFGVSYASVPLYKAFCQVTGFGGTTQVADEKKARSVKPLEGANIIRVYFDSNVHCEMPWTFTPTQSEVRIVPGETALAFYTVKNTTDHAITGVATYNVFPPKAGLYFNKIQCFCFEEQRLGAHEEIDMPVFFFVDPEIALDPSMENLTYITLSYTFFKTGEEEPEKDEQVDAKATTTSKINSIANSS
jgi:cytochrome c oxidase assembly protein subunit 11